MAVVTYAQARHNVLKYPSPARTQRYVEQDAAQLFYVSKGSGLTLRFSERLPSR